MVMPERGEIWWVALDPTLGSKIRKTRPCVVAKTLQTATEKVNMAIYEIARLPAMWLTKRCTSTPSRPYSCIQRKCRSTVLRFHAE
jgi:hypothetical protein